MEELRGATEPRVFTPPKRPLNPDTSWGFALCEFVEAIGYDLLPWEKWLAIHMLELDESGYLRFRVVLAIVARQNGKTLFSELLAAFFLFVVRVQMVLGTSLSLDQAEEVWEKLIEDIVMPDPELSAEVEKVGRTNGNKQLRLTGGRRYKVSATMGSAERKGGRGKSVDLLLMDEIREHRNWRAWGSATKTTLARPNALTFCISNAGDGESVVMAHLRKVAHRAIGDPDGICKDMEDLPPEAEGVSSDTLGLFEWSAPPDATKWDRRAWAQANPSLGYGFLTERALASACATDDDAVFRTECMCQWVQAAILKPFPEGAWEAGIDPESEIAPTSQIVYGVDMSADRTMGAIAACGLRDDGLWHVELVARRAGTDWMVDWFRKRATPQRRMVLAMQGRGAPITAYSMDFMALENVEVIPCEGRDVGAWTGRFYDAVCACSEDSSSDVPCVMHRPQPALDDAAMTAQKRDLGDGAFTWDRRKSPEDVSPLMACTMAFGASAIGRSEVKKAQTVYASAYADRRLVVV